MYPKESKASLPREVKRLPRIPAPTHTSRPTVRKQITARPHIFIKAWPRPGTIQPATATTKARASRLELSDGVACPAFSKETAGGVSSGIFSFPRLQVAWRPKVPATQRASRVVLPPRNLRQQRQNRGLHRSGDPGFFFVHIDIDFGAYAKFRQINAWFHGIAGARDQVACVMSFESIHVRTVAMDLFADAVAGAVEEISSVTGLFDDG